MGHNAIKCCLQSQLTQVNTKYMSAPTSGPEIYAHKSSVKKLGAFMPHSRAVKSNLSADIYDLETIFDSGTSEQVVYDVLFWIICTI